RLLIVREPAGAPELPVRAGQSVLWDGRFEIELGRRAGAVRGRLTLGPLAAAGGAELRAAGSEPLKWRIPAPARPALPALRDGRGLVAVPHLGYARGRAAELTIKKCLFAPKLGLTAAAFTVA
ncbi:MAG: hypothetical protein ACE5KF_08220, partial [Kiloniellaceae bacterium]